MDQHLGSTSRSGIPGVGDLAWGSHLYHFYRTREDLVDSLVPYFKAGLENQELCLWITGDPLRAAEARELLSGAVAGVDACLERGQIEIVDCEDWHSRDGSSDTEQALRAWIERQVPALSLGYRGLRLTGNICRLEPRGPSGFTACEARVNRIFRRHRIIGLCSYRLDHCSPEEVIDVVRHHEFGLVRRNGAWEPIQSAALRLRQDELPALDFLSVASHELKTPLASLKLYLEGTARLLRRQPIRPEELARRVARALEQCSRMEILIGNLLEASRARSGRLPVVLEPGDLSELVQRVCARLADELSRRGCALSVHAEVPVYGLWDRLRMDQVLTNLLTNAMKYAPGAPVAVTLEGADGWARLTVRDHGPGIRPEDQAGIFERFRQLAPHAGQGGFGLGLWIVRQAVETLGGTVRVDSAPGNGTAFVVELPCSPPRQQEPG